MGHQNSFMPSFGDEPLWADRDVVTWGLMCCCFGGPAGFPAQGLHSQRASVDGRCLFVWALEQTCTLEGDRCAPQGLPPAGIQTRGPGLWDTPWRH